MSLRFTETKKWQDDWYLSLSNDYRIVWIYLLDNCSISGIISSGLKALNYFCNTQMTEDLFFEVFKDRVVRVDNANLWFIPKFIKVQYPSGLQSNKPLIVSVRKEISRYDLYGIIKQSLGNDYPIIKEPLDNSYPTIRDTGKGNKGGVGGIKIPNPLPGIKNSELKKIAEGLKEEEVIALRDVLPVKRTTEQGLLIYECTQLNKFYHLF